MHLDTHAFRVARRFGAALSLCVATTSFAVPTNADLETAFQRYQWDETAQIAWELVQSNPKATNAKVKGAYALFQRGYINGALALLKRLSDEEWKQLPQGQDRFVEIVTLFQKKVPNDVLPSRLEIASVEKVSPYLRDELRFTKGRALTQRGDYANAKSLLVAVGKNSRYFPSAHYLLGSIAVREGDMEKAQGEFSKIFEPQVLDQMSEFWRDVSSNVTSHWGASIKVLLDTQGLLQGRVISELGVLGFARLAYAKEDYKTALFHYDRIPSDSPYYSRANYEKIWTLLNMGDHAAAATAALKVAGDDQRFESLEARPARALIFVDHGQTSESRAELERFETAYAKAKKAIERFLEYKTNEDLPAFVKADMEQDPRFASFREYEGMLKREIAELEKQDPRLFPLYKKLAAELEPQITYSQSEIARMAKTYAERRLKDLERLKIQARLILAETYLEDRELLRKEFHTKKSPSEADVNAHDQMLVDLLEKSVATVDEAIAMSKRRPTSLEFRQAELLWELSTARGILSIGTGKESDRKAADAAKDRALAIALRIAKENPKFSKNGQAMFFSGFMLLEMGRTKEAEEQLKAFVAKYPRHQHAPDAYRIIGDSMFDRNDFNSALSYYKHILEFSDSPIVGYALYKLSWCLYNASDYPRALLGLQRATEWAKQREDEKQGLNLARESRRDLISVYAEVGDYKKAFEYFKSVLGDGAYDAYVQYGKDLDAAGQYEKSAEVWRSLVAMNPSDPRNIGYQTYVLRGVYKLRAWDRVQKELHEMVDRYPKLIREPKPEGEVAFEAEKMAREAVLAQHYEFKQSKETNDVERILKLDVDYLKGFGTWPNAQEVQYEYALYLMNRKRYAESLPALKANWVNFGKAMKEPVREESLRNLLFVLEKLTAEEKDPKKPTQMSEDLVEFSGEYQTLYPKSKNTRAIAGVQAATYFKYGQAEEGAKASVALLATGADDEAGKLAFQNLRVAYYQKKDWKATYEWATELAKRPDMKSRESDLQRIRGEASFLYAESIEKDDEAAAKEFLRIADDPGMGFFREKALYNAFVRTERAGKKTEALAIANRLEKASPKFEGLKQAAGLRGAMYQESGDYERAFPMLQQMVRAPDKDMKPEFLTQARLNAALIAEAVGDTDYAEKLFRKVIADSGDKANPAADEAKRALDRMNGGVKREVASEPKGWSDAMKMRVDFEKAALPKSKDLAERIQKGALRLDAATKALLAISNTEGVEPKFAFEAYCGLPFLYIAYADGIRGLGAKGPDELKTELEKIAAPIGAKGEEFGAECLKRGAEAEHDGPLYRRALRTWGWQKDEALAERAGQLLDTLVKAKPWIDPAKVELEESKILAKHLQGISDDETWYALAVRRLERKEPGLARLTLVDALGRKPSKTGRILNTLTVLAEKQLTPAGATANYEKAATEGSAAAWVSVGIYHLKGQRLEKALSALRNGESAGAFAGRDNLVAFLKEFPKP